MFTGCMSAGVIMHEFLHAVGLYHTQVMLVPHKWEGVGGWGRRAGGVSPFSYLLLAPHSGAHIITPHRDPNPTKYNPT